MEVMDGDVRRGIWLPVPGPMSRTVPVAVWRRGGIRAEEPVGGVGEVPVLGGGGRDAGRMVSMAFIMMGYM